MTKKDIASYIQRDPDNKATSTTAQSNVAVILSQLAFAQPSTEMVENLAASGISLKNICGILGKNFSYFSDNPDMKEAFDRGRATVGSRVRARLLDAALEENSMQAAIYLDKIYGGDTVASEVNVNVSTVNLDEIPTETLLDVLYLEHNELPKDL
jgi:hypothetical protein